MSYPQNHYEGPVKRTASQKQANRLLKDPDAIDDRIWKMLAEEGGLYWHKHPKTGIEHQLWTDGKEGVVAMQKLLGWW